MSNEFKGTPGPWHLHLQAAERYVPTLTGSDHYDEEYVAVVGANGEVICDNAQYYSQSVAKSDAILIAAAPDLKDALQKLVLLYEADEGCRSMPEYIGAIAALKKATSISN